MIEKWLQIYKICLARLILLCSSNLIILLQVFVKQKNSQNVYEWCGQALVWLKVSDLTNKIVSDELHILIIYKY